MITVRRDKDIYDTSGGWFRARWHFSFDAYRDYEERGEHFRALVEELRR